MSHSILTTPRLELRELDHGDDAFILELLNDPLWIRFIGNKNIDTLEAARGYIDRTINMYRTRGFGLWAVVRRADGERLGLCGLIKRDTLPDVDLGFALLTRYQAQGYGYEAARETMRYARERLNLGRVVAITSPDNAASSGLLEKLGFGYERTMQFTPGDDVKLYAAAY